MFYICKAEKIEKDKKLFKGYQITLKIRNMYEYIGMNPSINQFTVILLIII